jgi:parallel beta-helix repeat protein
MTGQYTLTTGEIFPLLVPAGVTIMGETVNQGGQVWVEGGGVTGNQLNLAIQLQEGAKLQGITVVNSAANGTGIWIDGVGATIEDCTLQDCGREGLLLTGAARVLVVNSLFRNNRTTGLMLLHHSKGEIRNSQFEGMRLGIAIIGQSAPLLVNNTIAKNQSGIAISDQASPVLRGNLIEANDMNGLILQGQALPDLGHPQNPGSNMFRNNRNTDLRNTTDRVISSVNNDLNPVKVQGSITFIPQQLPPLPFFPSQPADPKLEAPDSQLPISNPQVLVPFPDTANHWAVAFIAALHDRGLITGFPDGRFKPNDPLTRAEYAAILAKTFDLSPRHLVPHYSDVPESFWGFASIAKTSRLGFLSGFPDLSFRPQQFLTRIQALVSLVAGLSLTGGSLTLLALYDDRAQIPSYATAAVATATQYRLVVNYPDRTRLNPQQTTTRAEITLMIYQALVLLKQAEALESAYVINPISRAASSPTFTDIQAHWAWGFIEALANQQLLQGFPDGSFQPDKILSRAEYAVLIAKAFNPTPRKPSISFKDVADNFWAKTAIDLAVEGGFLAGSGNALFQPEAPVQRFQVLLSLASGLRLSPGNPDGLKVFSDAQDLPAYAQKMVAAALEKNLILSYPDGLRPASGYRTLLEPKRSTTRGEAVAMIYQGLVYQGRMPAL